MKLFIKFLLSIFSLFVLIFLVFHTFFSPDISLIWKQNYFLWDKTLAYLTENKLEANKVNSETISVQNIGAWNKIYFLTWSVNTVDDNKVVLEKGLYIFDFKESNPTTITGDGFHVNAMGPGTFIIQYTKNSDIRIFPLTTILKLGFIHPTKKTLVTETELYPNFSIRFNARKNIFLQDADFFKIQLVFPISYWEGSIFWVDNLLSAYFVERISTLESDKFLLEQTFNFIKSNIDSFNQENSKYKNPEFFLFFWESLFEKYNSLLVNSKKEATYLKNKILRSFFHLMVQGQAKKLVEIKNDLKKLHLLDSKDFQEVNSRIWELCYEILWSNTATNSQQSNCINLLQNISIKDSLTTIQKSYSLLHFWNSQNISFIEIEKFLQEYLNDYTLNEDGTTIKIDSLLFSLRNILLSKIQNISSEENIDSASSLLADYTKLATAHFSKSDISQIQTSLYNNSAILIQIKKILLSEYLEPERNKYNLYEKKTVHTNSKTISQLKNSHNTLLEFLEKNKWLLDLTNNKDKSLINIYKINRIQLKEIFLALEDYDSYIAQYDKSKQTLINEKTLLELASNNQPLSLESATDYLSQFVWLDLSHLQVWMRNYEYCTSIDLSVTDEKSQFPNYCYEIEWLKINNQPLGFFLHPYENNLLNQIFLQWKEKYWEYILDEIKIELEELQRSTTQSNKNSLKFDYFFINTFNKKIADSWEDFSGENNIDTDSDKIIANFKRNKLFGDNWDFTLINRYFNIDYNDIEVKRKWDDFLIIGEDMVFKLPHPNPNARDIYWKFSSKYDFAKHTFYDIELSFYSREEDITPINWEPIKISENIDVLTLQEKIKSLYLAWIKK